MSDFFIRSGDRFPVLEATLYRDGGVADLTGAVSVQLLYKIAGGAEVAKTAELLAPLKKGKVRYVWGAGDTDVPGDYDMYWRVTYSGGEKESFPNDRFLTMTFSSTL